MLLLWEDYLPDSPQRQGQIRIRWGKKGDGE